MIAVVYAVVGLGLAAGLAVLEVLKPGAERQRTDREH